MPLLKIKRYSNPKYRIIVNYSIVAGDGFKLTSSNISVVSLLGAFVKRLTATIAIEASINAG